MKVVLKGFILAFILSCIVRLPFFSQIPAGLNRDEAALGYNAFSILKNGKDEWGVSYPIIFKSFGDFKLPGYIYTLIPFISVFGLSEIAVRLPSALAGVLLIPLTYMLVKRISKNEVWAVLSSLIVAVSPWAIHYSSVGFEANLALSLFCVSLILLIYKGKSVLPTVCGLGFMFFSLLTYKNCFDKIEISNKNQRRNELVSI